MRGKQTVVIASVAALAASVLPVAIPAQAAHGYSTTTTSGQTLRWNPCQREITYQVNVRKVGNKRAQRKALREVKLAFRKLGSETGMPFVYRGTTKVVPTGNDWFNRQGENSEIVVAYVRQNSAKFRTTLLSAGAWGVGGSLYVKWGVPETAVIGKGYVVLDSAKALRLKTGFGAGPTRGNLVLHELGHVVGLGHAASKRELMYPTISKSTPAGFAAGDRSGLAKLGALAGCISVPSNVFPSS